LADTQDKHSHSRAQGSRRRAQASTQPASPKRQFSPRKRRKPKRHNERDRFHQIEEFKGKIVELIQIFTSGEYSSISVRFQDKTAVDFVIDPCFTLETEYTDWKTGDMRRIKRWPLIYSAVLRG